MIGKLIMLAAIVYLIVKRSDIIAGAARIVYARGKTEKAMKMYDFAYKIGKMKFNPNLNYAYLTLKNGDIEKADKLFNMLRMTPLKPQEKMQLKASHALVFWKKGEVSEAIEMLEEVIEKVPTTATYGSLGYMYIYSGQYQKALDFNLKAYDYNSSDIIITENVALIYFKLGEMDKAKEYYDKLIAMNPPFPDCLYEYGQFLIKCGDTQRGIEYYKKALDCNFSFLSVIKRTDIIRELEQLEGTNQ